MCGPIMSSTSAASRPATRMPAWSAGPLIRTLRGMSRVALLAWPLAGRGDELGEYCIWASWRVVSAPRGGGAGTGEGS
jgi:hypothetical protein